MLQVVCDAATADPNYPGVHMSEKMIGARLSMPCETMESILFFIFRKLFGRI